MRAILLSGGMDSTVLACELHAAYGPEDLVALYVWHSHSTDEEYKAAVSVAKHLGIELIRGDITPTSKIGDVVPARNMLLVAWAANALEHLGATDLFVGFCREDRQGFKDCDDGFVRLCNQMLRHTGSKLFVRAPYQHLSKPQILALPSAKYAELVSYSCYESNGPCGRCSSCRLRATSLKEAAL